MKRNNFKINFLGMIVNIIGLYSFFYLEWIDVSLAVFIVGNFTWGKYYIENKD